MKYLKNTLKKAVPSNVYISLIKLWHYICYLHKYSIIFFATMILKYKVNSAIIGNNNNVIVIISNMDWNDYLFQRPHQLARAFARNECLVFYVTPNGIDKVSVIKQVEKNLYLCSLLEGLTEIQNPTIYLLRPQQRNLLAIFSKPYNIIYDYLDDLTLMIKDGSPEIKRAHDWLVKNATVISTTADRLQKEVISSRPDAILCPNAVDYAFFSSPTSIPKELIAIVGRPVVGYHGAIAEWFDFDLMYNVIVDCPECNFVFIGKDFTNTLCSAKWTNIDNFFFLGPKQYKDLPGYTANYTIGIIPFKINSITLSTSPVKIFEYFAAGKPVISTDLPECRKYKHVSIAYDTNSFLGIIRMYLSVKIEPSLIRNVAINNDWTIRAEQLTTALNEKQRCVNGYTQR